MGFSRASKNLAHKLALKNNPLHYKRVPFEKLKLKKAEPVDRSYSTSRMKKGTVIGIGVGP